VRGEEEDEEDRSLESHVPLECEGAATRSPRAERPKPRSGLGVLAVRSSLAVRGPHRP